MDDAADPPTPAELAEWQDVSEFLQPRCLGCGYVLTGLVDDQRCPECGRPFNLDNPDTYTMKPPFAAWRFWLPGLTLAIVGGLAGSIGLLWMGNWGVALWFGAPFVAGSLLGYRVRSRWFILLVLILATVVGMCMGMVTLDLAGVFCGMALVGVFLGPVFVGAVLGSILRIVLKRTRFSQRWHLPALILLGTLFLGGWLEGAPALAPIETVSTTQVIDASTARCWDAIVFYEDVDHQPPLILRIGLAHPLYTRGRSQAVGDIKTCVYNKGQITKRMTAVEPERLLAFDVIDQHIGYERDVRLMGGAFRFDPLKPSRSRVCLQTTYQPLLHPRWAWRPFEHYAVHTLHGHVLEGMQRRTAEPAECADHTAREP